MPFAVCTTAVSPLRKHPDHRSEMISQLLLGEFATVLEQGNEFMYVQCLHDGYIGWCQRKQWSMTGAPVVPNGFASNAVDMVTINHQLCRISIGTPVFKNGLDINGFAIAYNTVATFNAPQQLFSKENIVSISSIYLNTPYLWGGRGIFGIDCSGFAQQVYRLLNIQLPRDACQQAEKGEAIGFLQEAQCGDLAFFDNEQGLVTHVGIMLGNEEIIHASGCVRIDKIDSQGIISGSSGLRTHRLRVIKRYW